MSGPAPRPSTAPRTSGARAGGLPALIALAAVLALSAAWPASVARAATITSGPPATTTSTSATIAFTASDRAPAVVCLLDGVALASRGGRCASPVSLTGLALGPHAFAVEERDSGGHVLDRAEHRWTIVAPSGPPAPVAVIHAPAAPSAQGALVQLDASASSGPIRSFSFDVDGNGSYETKCGGTAKVGAVYSKPGTYEVAVLVDSGKTKVAASTKVTVGTGKSAPPQGSAAFAAPVTVATCVDTDAIAAWIEAYKCPKSVVVGIGEAAFPAGSPASACFKRTTVDDGAGPHELFVAPETQLVALNGLTLWPLGASLALDATAQRARVRKGAKPAPAGQAVQLFAKDAVGHVDLETTIFKLDWDLSKPSTVAELPLGSAASSGPSGGDFLGLPVPSTLKAPLTLPFSGAARIPIRVTLPKPFASLSSAEIVLELDNTDGPKVAAAGISFAKIPFGAISIEGLGLTWHAEGASDVWDGSLELVLPPGAHIGGTIRIRDGALQQLAVSAKPPPPGLPVTCCLYLTELHGSMNEVALSAGGTIGTALQVLGKQLISFTGNVFVFYANGFSVGVKGDLKAIDGKFTLAKGSLTASSSSLSFNGGIDKTFAILDVNAFVGGSVSTTGKWHAAGYGKLCIDVGTDYCAGGGVAASNVGIAGCVSVDLEIESVEVGGLIKWNGGWSVFWECSFGVLSKKVGASGADSASGPRAITLRRGLRSALIRVTGEGGAPLVALRGPGGRRVVAGPGTGGKGRGRLVVRTPSASTTDIVIARPAPGRWTITPLAGSAPIASIATAESLPGRQATATVAGSGRRRVLRYRVATAPGRTVTFIERGVDVERTIGRARGSSGAIRFTPADGPAGRRTVEALIEAGGRPAKVIRVASFRAPKPFAPAAPTVRASRRGAALLARWRPVAGAASYRVSVTLSDGRRLELVERGAARTRRIAGVSARTSAVVRVRGVARSGRLGRPGTARLPALPPAAVPRSARLAALRAGELVVRCVPAADGTCDAVARLGRRIVAHGERAARYATPAAVRLRLTPAGRRLVAAGRTLRLTVAVPGERDVSRRLTVRG